MGWLTPRRSRSFAGSQGAEISRRGGGPSRVPARVVLLLLAMVAALAQQAFAQTTPAAGARWTPGGAWTHDVSTTSLTGQLMLQQSITLDGGSRHWGNVALDACPWTRVRPPLPSTSCVQLKAYSALGFPSGSPLTVTNFAPTQAMIDNGGVVIRLRWRNYNSPAGNNVGMTEWVPLVPPLGATLVLTPASISENAGVSTVTATLNRASSAAVTVTVSASPGAGTDFTLSSATELTIAAGATTSTSTGTAVTITANDNDVEAPDKSVTVSGTATATGEDVEDPPDVTLTLLEDDMAGFVFEPSGSLIVTPGGAASTYTVKLSSEPTGAVTVSIASDNGDVTVDPSSLTFDAANWATGQPVTVTAAADDDDFADTATLSHRGEGGGYDGVTGALSAAVAGGARIAASGGTRTGASMSSTAIWSR